MNQKNMYIFLLIFFIAIVGYLVFMNIKISEPFDNEKYYASEHKTLKDSVQKQFQEIIKKNNEIERLPIIYKLNNYIHQIPDELFSYDKEKDISLPTTNIEQSHKDYSFIYLGDIVSNKSVLNENTLKEYLKVPLRCLLDTGKQYSDRNLIYTIDDNELFLHPIYHTIKLNARNKPIYKIKPCAELQTTFKEKIEFYKNVKERCNNYAHLNNKMPIFENLEYEIKKLNE